MEIIVAVLVLGYSRGLPKNRNPLTVRNPPA